MLRSALCILVAIHSLMPWQAAADAFDWRNVGGSSFVTPVRNQGSAGTCTAFASTGTLESKYLITRNDPSYDINLSEQHLVCAGIVPTSGAWPNVALNYFTSSGIVREAELPYTEENESPFWPLQGGWEYRVVKSTANENGLSDSVADVKAAVKRYGPLCVVISSDDLDEQHQGSTSTDHSVLLIGFRDDSSYAGGGYWIIKNSWGTGWFVNEFSRGRVHQFISS